MNDELLFERLASHDGPAAPDGDFEDRVYSILQREMHRRRSLRPALFLAATLLLVLTITAAIAVGSGLIKPPWLDRWFIPIPSPASPSPSLTATPTQSTSVAPLPDLDMPTAYAGPAGECGWTGGPGSRTGMHNVDGVDVYRMTQLVFAVDDDCFASGEGPEPSSVTVAGLDGWYVVPYDGPGVLFMPERDPGQTTEAYSLSIDGRTLCVYLTWDASTTPDELDAARQVVEAIRGQTYGSGIRIVFTLAEGWDTG
jgi:hypothetical protein